MNLKNIYCCLQNRGLEPEHLSVRRQFSNWNYDWYDDDDDDDDDDNDHDHDDNEDDDDDDDADDNDDNNYDDNDDNNYDDDDDEESTGGGGSWRVRYYPISIL